MGEEPGRLSVDRPLHAMSSSGRRASAFACVLAASVAAIALPSRARGQEPPDTVVADTLGVETDTVPEELAGVDTLAMDTVFHNLPRVEAGAPVGWARGVWEWSLDEIQASGALTLADLLADVPGVIPMLAGDHGTPVAVTAFGLGGGGVRIVRDGFEVLPLEGGLADLARVGLTGISHVRAERSMGELVVFLRGFQHEGGQPYSLVEAGTGDQNNNFFRGTFADPRAIGGSVGVGLERLDARGPRGDEPGSVTGSWLRYQFHRGDAAGLAVDLRRVGSQSDAPLYASPVSRTDLVLRARARLGESISTEAYWGESTHDVEDEEERYELEGGTRSQAGLRALVERGPAYVQGAYRKFGGDDLPSGRLDLAAGADLPAIGGFAAELGRASWAGSSTTAKRLRGWTRPVWGFSLFGSWESGAYGARTFPVRRPENAAPGEPDTDAAEPDADAAEPLFRISDRTANRAGAMWAWRGYTLSGALLDLEVDSLLPLGIEPDRGQPALAGGSRSGWEVWVRVPMPVDGMRFEGFLQQWDEGWSYLPRRTYGGALSFHRVYLKSENLEWWWTIGVRGHDPMSVRQVVEQGLGDEGEPVGPGLASVPFYQNWYLRLQLRIVSVRIFIGWENATVRRNLQNFPDRLLPITRAVYGIRWALWN